MNNITRHGELDLTDLKYMDLDAAHHEKHLVRYGDVLFNRTNSADLVGKSAIYRRHEPMAYAGYLIRLRVNDTAEPEYLAAYLNTHRAKQILRKMCKSIIGMANINAREVQTMKIAVPSLALQRKFARRVEAVERVKASQRAHLAELDGLFTSLQDRAFSGRL